MGSYDTSFKMYFDSTFNGVIFRNRLMGAELQQKQYRKISNRAFSTLKKSIFHHSIPRKNKFPITRF